MTIASDIQTFRVNKLTISLVINIALILTGAILVVKRIKFMYDLEHPSVYASYLDNPQYIEQMKIVDAYHYSAKIAMLGDSHVYKAHWNELLGRGDVANRGIGSDITDGFLHRLPAVLECHPAICFIEGGVNDLAHFIPDEVIVDNLKHLVDTLRSNGVIPVLHTVFLAAQSEPKAEFWNRRIVALNSKIKQLAFRLRLDCIDINPKIAQGGFLRPEFAQNDGGHLTNAAYSVWASAIRQVLSKYSI